MGHSMATLLTLRHCWWLPLLSLAVIVTIAIDGAIGLHYSHHYWLVTVGHCQVTIIGWYCYWSLFATLLVDTISYCWHIGWWFISFATLHWLSFSINNNTAITTVITLISLARLISLIAILPWLVIIIDTTIYRYCIKAIIITTTTITLSFHLPYFHVTASSWWHITPLPPLISLRHAASCHNTYWYARWLLQFSHYATQAYHIIIGHCYDWHSHRHTTITPRQAVTSITPLPISYCHYYMLFVTHMRIHIRYGENNYEVSILHYITASILRHIIVSFSYAITDIALYTLLLPLITTPLLSLLIIIAIGLSYCCLRWSLLLRHTLPPLASIR